MCKQNRSMLVVSSRKIKYAMLVAMLTWLFNPSYSQTNKGTCLKEVEQIFKKMYDDLSSLSNVTYINYQITTKARSSSEVGDNKVIVSDIKTYSTKTGVWFISNELCTYRDMKHTFTVIPKRKEVYWAETAITDPKLDRVAQIRNMHDTLVKHSKNVTCENIKDPTGATKLVKLELDKKWMDLLQIKAVYYYLNDVNHSITKQIIEYTNKKKIESVEYLFKEISYNYTKVDMNVPVKAIFIEANNKLKAPYTNYKLIDVRNQKK